MPEEIRHGHDKIRELRAKLDRIQKEWQPKRETKDWSPVDEVRRAIRKKRKASPAPAAPSSTPRPDIVYQRNLPRHEPPRPARAMAPSRHVVLEDAVAGEPVDHPERGTSFLLRVPLSDIEDAGMVSRNFETGLLHDPSVIAQRVNRTCDLPRFAPEDVVFMDIETAGLSGAPLFLIGIMVWEDGQFVVRQHLARNYAEEASVIAFFLDACRERKLLATFNGKSFDLPFIRIRAVSSGIPFDAALEHFDLLHESRRIWAGHFQDCKLQTLEHHICGRTRHGDIPGSEIPDAYHAYVRTANAWQIVDVLKHNMLDLVTLADLMTHMPAP